MAERSVSELIAYAKANAESCPTLAENTSGIVAGETLKRKAGKERRRYGETERLGVAALREALRGRIKRHHRFLLQLHVQQIDALDAAIAELDREVDTGLACFRDAVERLSTIPGISQLSAQVIVSEIGTDMSPFATDAHLRSWAGLCPRSDQSAGKRGSTRLRKGAPWLKATLVQCCLGHHAARRMISSTRVSRIGNGAQCATMRASHPGGFAFLPGQR
jgi:transposase